MKQPDTAISNQPLSFYLAVNGREIPWLLLNICLYGAGTLSILALSYGLGKVIDGLTTGQPVTAFLVIMVVALVMAEVGYRTGHMCEIRIRTRIRARIKKALFDHSRTLSFGYFSDRFAGEIAHKIAMCAEAFERLTIIFTNGACEELLLIGVAAALLGSLHPGYALFLLVWGVLLVTCLGLLARRTDTFAGHWAREETHTTGALVDVYANITAVKVYGGKADKLAVHRQIDTEAAALLALGKWDVRMYACEGAANILLVLGLLFISAWLFRHGQLTLGQAVFVAGVAYRLYSSVWEIGPRLAEFIRYRGEVRQNLTDLLVAPTVQDTVPATLHPPAAATVALEYRNVTFGYSPENPVLGNLSLTIQPGQKLGIVGLSGAGKTTFANLLLRFFDVTQGAVLLNGTDIREITQDFLRAHVSSIAQDTSLFHASIADNIAYGSPHATPAEIETAARMAYADDFIQKLEHGYASIVGERGIKLSGGQRQRIAIARALLANRPLFLLDEATSALDTDSEQKIQQGLLTLMENKTVIAIAHRLSTLSHMDTIIYLENGRITEQGSHAALLRLNGQYARLWHMQAGGFLPTVGKLD